MAIKMRKIFPQETIVFFFLCAFCNVSRYIHESIHFWTQDWINWRTHCKMHTKWKTIAGLGINLWTFHCTTTFRLHDHLLHCALLLVVVGLSPHILWGVNDTIGTIKYSTLVHSSVKSNVGVSPLWRLKEIDQLVHFGV